MLLDELNQQQQDAVREIDGPIIIIAGAGSGKTKTLTCKIAYDLQNGISPYNILALTFTNKAAEEMKERITELVGTPAKYILMGTFHSIFSRILRLESERLGFVSRFSIYDTDDAKSLIKTIIKEMNLDEKRYTVSFVMERISKAKNNLFSPSDYLNSIEIQAEDRAAHKEQIGYIYQQYNRRLKGAMAMDFDDLLFNMNVLLRDFPDVLKKYQERFRYIMVDEYQDTNFAQYLIIKKLAALHRNICVVGDDAQSIYAFRGASIRNILNFKTDYPDAKVFKLEQNYRSTQNIVNAANCVIANNEDQIKKNVWTSNPQGCKIRYTNHDSDRAEAEYVCQTIKDKVIDGDNYSDFAVLYRTNMQSRVLEEALRLRNTPYRLYGGISFYSRKEIKDVLAYFRLVSNNDDNGAFERSINNPARGIGNTTINRLKIIAAEHNVSLFSAALNLPNFSSKINGTTVEKIVEFCKMIVAFSKTIHQRNAYELGEEIIRMSGIKTALKNEESIEAEDRINNIDELINSLQAFVRKEDDIIIDELTGEEISQTERTLDVFLSQVSLMTDADNDDEGDKVVLMTIHAAKGLEFPYVFIVGMEENLFPSLQSLTQRSDTEEERRLFYVAITRAEKELMISSARMRFRYGELVFAERSRFVEEIDEAYLEQSLDGKKSFPALHKDANDNSNRKKPLLKLPSKDSKKPLPTSLPHPVGGNASSALRKFEIGSRVVHSRFGEGTILLLEGEGDNRKAMVNFDVGGKKILVLRFAKLEIL
ncbi:MAG: UvrD-helicase domain-containing protein [Bacteroidales bacterium]|jgi:DNA helicase-2/ATP-dependent DNA helicase PcrA|nr:UvrD-helicase domain-containing protein [Bacteroidales bacterium]